MIDGRQHDDGAVAAETAAADMARAINTAIKNGSRRVEMSASLPAAKAIWYALKMLHPRAPVLSLLPGTIAGEMWLSMIARDMERQLAVLREIVDRAKGENHD